MNESQTSDSEARVYTAGFWFSLVMSVSMHWLFPFGIRMFNYVIFEFKGTQFKDFGLLEF